MEEFGAVMLSGSVNQSGCINFSLTIHQATNVTALWSVATHPGKYLTKSNRIIDTNIVSYKHEFQKLIFHVKRE